MFQPDSNEIGFNSPLAKTPSTEILQAWVVLTI